jgi:cobalamin biosynthesis protein CobC
MTPMPPSDAVQDGPSPRSRDHGGGLDAAITRWGGSRDTWLDLSTGINPVPYPVADIDAGAWADLPDRAAEQALKQAARRFWNVPPDAEILAAPGASALIARLPSARPAGRVTIPGPTYNEHAAAFKLHGWQVDSPGTRQRPPGDRPAAKVVVHPNNPDGHLWRMQDIDAAFTIIDESFCDVTPDATLMASATRPGTVILKSFGKFWGLAGLRLGFAIGDPSILAGLQAALGPWAVSGPAQRIGTRALHDDAWAQTSRARLEQDAARLDALMTRAGVRLVGGTTLFRLYDTHDAAAWQARLARNRVWSRIFPYSTRWLRLGLPHPGRWPQIEAALE